MLDALRLHEQASHEQQQAVSNVLTSADHRMFGTELANIQSAEITRVEPKKLATTKPNPVTCSKTRSRYSQTYSFWHVNTISSDKVEQEFDQLVENIDFLS